MNIVCLDLEGVLVPEIWIAFAEETGISKTYVQNVEKGKANPTLGTVQ